LLESKTIHKNSTIWENHYPEYTVPIFVRRKTKNVSDLIASIALCGPCSIRDCAKFVRTKSKEKKFTENNKEIKFRGLIKGTSKEGKNYDGLISQGYVIDTGKITSQQNRPIHRYVLTLKGCLLAIGYQFDDDELASFIKSAARNHLYFSYLKKISEETSISFVKEIFILPIQTMIKKGKITLDDDIMFYFSNLADASEYALYTKLTNIQKEFFDPKKNNKITLSEFEKHTGNIEIEVLMKNTFYFQQPTEDWIDRIVNYFYNKDDDLEFYESYCDGIHETRLLYEVMSRIHSAYYAAINLGYAAKQTNKLPPHSKRWKLHYKFDKPLKYPPISGIETITAAQLEEYQKRHK